VFHRSAPVVDLPGSILLPLDCSTRVRHRSHLPGASPTSIRFDTSSRHPESRTALLATTKDAGVVRSLAQFARLFVVVAAASAAGG
jgi:hypothetical protein